MGWELTLTAELKVPLIKNATVVTNTYGWKFTWSSGCSGSCSRSVGRGSRCFRRSNQRYHLWGGSLHPWRWRPMSVRWSRRLRSCHCHWYIICGTWGDSGWGCILLYHSAGQELFVSWTGCCQTNEDFFLSFWYFWDIWQVVAVITAS